MPDAVPFEAGEGADAVLFVHGFNDVPAVWRRFSEPFAAAGFHIEAMHLDGLGERRLRLWFSFPLSRWQQIVSERVNALARTHRRVFLVGYSMGGSLVLDTVYRHDFRKGGETRFAYAPIAGAALLAPLVELSRARAPIMPAWAWFVACRALLPGLRCVPSVFKSVQGTVDDPTFRYRRDRFMSVSVLAAMFDLVSRVRSFDLSRIETPLKVYVAGNDRVVDTAATRRYFSTCPAVRSLDEVPGAPHALPLLSGWRGLADSIIRDFRAGARA